MSLPEQSAYKWISVECSKSIKDPLWSISVDIDGLEAPPTYSHYEVIMKNAEGQPVTICVGLLPSTERDWVPGNSKVRFQGVDYTYFLTRQYIPEQMTASEGLTYSESTIDNPDYTGGETGSSGTVDMCMWRGSDMCNYLEQCLGSVTCTEGVFGEGGNWDAVTGIHPYRIQNPESYNYNYKPKDFEFGWETTKYDVIEEFCNYAHMIFNVKPVQMAGLMVGGAYFIHEDMIDEESLGLDLPPIALIHKGDNKLIGDVKVIKDASEKINRVIIVGQDEEDGIFYRSVRESYNVTYGYERPIEFIEVNADYKTHEICEEVADLAWEYFKQDTTTYTASFLDRVDLQLMQKIVFVDSSDIPWAEIPNDEMRITAISYKFANCNTIVNITFTKDRNITYLKGIDYVLKRNYVENVKSIVNKELEKVRRSQLGEVEAISSDGKTAVVRTEQGTLKKVRVVEG